MKRFVPVLSVFVVITGMVMAQRGSFGGGGRRGNGYDGYGEGGGNDQTQTAREVPSHSTGTPMWENPPAFQKDVFTFTRVRYGTGFGGFRGGRWTTDMPDSDLNLSFRLQQMTSIKVDPNGRVLDLTDPKLVEYPWLYIVEPGALQFTELEAQALRKHLLNGGFLWFDDFWGESAMRNVEQQMKRVFPERSFVETSLDHPIYHSVFEIRSKGQVPGIRYWQRSGGETSERGADSDVVHHRAIFDDKGRLMVFASHNTDNGDGWEREGENTEYFKNYAEKFSYPLGINIIFYVMTH